MTDDLQRRGLIADLSRRLALLDLAEVRALDRIALRLEQLHFGWRRRTPTSPFDRDPKWHLAETVSGVVITRCHGRWSAADDAIAESCPPVTERCLACQRAAWSDSASDLDPLIAAVLELIAAEDLARKNLQDAARAELGGAG
jgi:hypothetical protein